MRTSTRQLTIIVSIITVMTTIVLGHTSAMAATTPTIITADYVITGADKSEHQIYSKPLDKGTYTVKVIANRDTPGRKAVNVLARSGNQKVSVNDVQATGFTQKNGDRNLVSDGTVKVAIQLGPDKVFSGDIRIELSSVTQPATGTSTAPAPSPVATTKSAAPDTQSSPTALPQTGPATAIVIAALVAASGYALHLAATIRYARYN